MLSYFVCLVVVLVGSQTKNVDDADIVSHVEGLLGECSLVVGAVKDFVHVYEEDEDRRRDGESSISSGVKDKLKTCEAIVGAVDSFRDEYKPFGSVSSTHEELTTGYINLRLSELDFIEELLNSTSKKMGDVLYVASRDGDAASNFHGACDGKGPTIVLVESTTGAIFGGYSDVSWGHSNGYHKSTNTFLFRIRPVMTKYPLTSGKEGYALYRHSSYGPVFGGGHDLSIASNARSNIVSYSNGGHSYIFPSYPNYQLADGEKNFRVKDYVVITAV